MDTGEKWVIGGAVATILALVGYEVYEKKFAYVKSASVALKPGAMSSMRIAKSGSATFTAPSGTVTSIDSGSVPGTMSQSGSTATFLASTYNGSGTLTIGWTDGSGVAQTSTIPVTVG